MELSAWEAVAFILFVHQCVAVLLIAEASEFGFSRSRRNVGICLVWLPTIVTATVAVIGMSVYALFAGEDIPFDEPFDSQDGLLSSEPAKA